MFIHYISICFQNVLPACCAWPSDSQRNWKPISCCEAPSVLSVKSYYQGCYASPVTSNLADAECNRWCLPPTHSTAESLQRNSLMGDLADKGWERWHQRCRCRTKCETMNVMQRETGEQGGRLRVMSFEHLEQKSLTGHDGYEGRRYRGGTTKESS